MQWGLAVRGHQARRASEAHHGRGRGPSGWGEGSSTGEEGKEAAKIQGSRPLASSFIRICSYEPAPKFQILYLFNKRPDFNKKRPSGFGK